MKVGFIAPDLSGSHGWSQYTVSLLKALIHAGVALKIVTTKRSLLPFDVPTMAVLPSFFPMERFMLGKLWLAQGQVRRFLADCDVIHCTLEPFAPLGAWIADKRPFWQTGHGTYVRLAQMRRFPVNRLYRWAFQRAQWACVSGYTLNILRQQIPQVVAHRVVNAIDPDRFGELPTRPHHQPKILTVGGVKARKGTLEIVRAIAQVAEQIPDVRAFVVGRYYNDGNYTRQVQDEIKRLNAPVTLTGYLDDEALRQLYAQADLFVLPSMNGEHTFEGFGLVHLEASALGLPVIGTRDCGVEEAIQDGVTGFLVSQTTIDQELPQAILRILSDPNLAQQMGTAGKAFARSRTWATVAQEMVALYQQSLSSGATKL